MTSTTVATWSLADCYDLVTDLGEAMHRHRLLEDSAGFVVSKTFGDDDGSREAERAVELELLAKDLRQRLVADERLRRAVDAFADSLDRRSEAWAKLSVAAVTRSETDLAEAQSLYDQADALEQRVESLFFHPDYDWSTANNPDLNPDVKEGESVGLFLIKWHTDPDLDGWEFVQDAVCGLP